MSKATERCQSAVACTHVPEYGTSRNADEERRNASPNCAAVATATVDSDHAAPLEVNISIGPGPQPLPHQALAESAPALARCSAQKAQQGPSVIITASSKL